MTELTLATGGVEKAAPVRVVHLGLGIFHRTHQAWYTHQANQLGGSPAAVASFTGRRPDAAQVLQKQDGLYHLIIRGESDRAELVTSVEPNDGNDLEAWCRHLADPGVGCLTMTVTEAGYRRSAKGGLDTTDPDVQWDIALPNSDHCDQAARTAPGRIVQGMAARMTAGSGPIAIVSCDNLIDNGPTCRRVVLDMASAVSTELATWISKNVSFVSTMVDRITPKTTAETVELARGLTGFDDAAPVVTEPFSEWVIAGDFPAGRPDWELAGARFVADVQPFEQRKLWLLNGAHCLLAYAGATLGHTTVGETMGDPVCRGWLEQWWDEACRHLSLPVEELQTYRADLTERFSNPGMRHTLAQIQGDGSEKLAVRIVPVLARERANGVVPLGAVLALAGWLAHLRDGTNVADPRAGELVEAARGGAEAATRRLLGIIAPTTDLADDAELVRAIAAAYRDLTTGAE